METITHDDVQLNDILISNIKFVSRNSKTGNISYVFEALATRLDQVKTISCQFDDWHIFDTKRYQNDLYEGVDLAMRNNH